MIKISVPNPCFEDKNKMSVSENGYFCKSCNHEVIDFRKYSDDEIQHYFQNLVSTKVCGIFNHTQLDFPILDYKTNSWRHIFIRFGFGLAAILTSILANGQAIIKKQPLQTTTSQPVITKKTLAVFPLIITGTVVSNEDDKALGISKSDPLIGATVIVFNTTKGTICDIDGNFTLNLVEEDFKNDSLQLQISFPGFESKTVTLFKNNLSITKFDFRLKQLENRIIEVEVIENGLIMGEVNIPTQNNKVITKKTPAVFPLIITGTVVSDGDNKALGISKNDPIIGATVIIIGTKKGVVGDIDGNFTLNISEEDFKTDSLQIQISYQDFELYTFKIYKNELNKAKYDVRLKPYEINITDEVSPIYKLQKRTEISTGIVAINKYSQPQKTENICKDTTLKTITEDTKIDTVKINPKTQLLPSINNQSLDSLLFNKNVINVFYKSKNKVINSKKYVVNINLLYRKNKRKADAYLPNKELVIFENNKIQLNPDQNGNFKLELDETDFEDDKCNLVFVYAGGKTHKIAIDKFDADVKNINVLLEPEPIEIIETEIDETEKIIAYKRKDKIRVKAVLLKIEDRYRYNSKWLGANKIKLAIYSKLNPQFVEIKKNGRVTFDLLKSSFAFEEIVLHVFDVSNVKEIRISKENLLKNNTINWSEEIEQNITIPLLPKNDSKRIFIQDIAAFYNPNNIESDSNRAIVLFQGTDFFHLEMVEHDGSFSIDFLKNIENSNPIRIGIHGRKIVSKEFSLTKNDLLMLNIIEFKNY